MTFDALGEPVQACFQYPVRYIDIHREGVGAMLRVALEGSGVISGENGPRGVGIPEIVNSHAGGADVLETFIGIMRAPVGEGK